jgi:hypothetical protein
VSRACRDGAHNAVVWNRVYFSPRSARRSAVGVWQGPPNALDAPNPMSSNRTIRTLGAPGGGRSGSMGGKCVSGSFASYVVRPESGRSGIGNTAREISGTCQPPSRINLSLQQGDSRGKEIRPLIVEVPAKQFGGTLTRRRGNDGHEPDVTDSSSGVSPEQLASISTPDRVESRLESWSSTTAYFRRRPRPCPMTTSISSTACRCSSTPSLEHLWQRCTRHSCLSG